MRISVSSSAHAAIVEEADAIFGHQPPFHLRGGVAAEQRARPAIIQPDHRGRIVEVGVRIFPRIDFVVRAFGISRAIGRKKGEGIGKGLRQGIYLQIAAGDDRLRAFRLRERGIKRRVSVPDGGGIFDAGRIDAVRALSAENFRDSAAMIGIGMGEQEKNRGGLSPRR